MSFNTRRFLALAVVLLAATFGGLLAAAFLASQVATILGVIAGVVVGMVLVVIWASQSS